MARQHLPHRRPAATREIEHAGHTFTVTVGFDLDGRPREVFASGAKVGTSIGHIISDACVWASLLLQHGAEPEDLAKSLGVLPVPWAEDQTEPASVLGAIAAAVIAEQGEEGPG